MEFEGADEVVSFDADDPARIDFLPIHDHQNSSDYDLWHQEMVDFLRRLHNGYWFAHHAYQSINLVYHGDIYRLPSFLGTFDLVVIGQILIHLSNPVAALAQIAARCRDTMVIVEGTLPDEQDTIAKIYSRAHLCGPPYIWWQYSVPLYEELLSMLNFKLIRVEKGLYHCTGHAWVKGDVELTTIVADRNTN